MKKKHSFKILITACAMLLFLAASSAYAQVNAIQRVGSIASGGKVEYRMGNGPLITQVQGGAFPVTFPLEVRSSNEAVVVNSGLKSLRTTSQNSNFNVASRSDSSDGFDVKVKSGSLISNMDDKTQNWVSIGESKDESGDSGVFDSTSKDLPAFCYDYDDDDDDDDGDRWDGDSWDDKICDWHGWYRSTPASPSCYSEYSGWRYKRPWRPRYFR